VTITHDTRLDAIAACSMCDADGLLWGAGDDGESILCSHERELGADHPMTGSEPLHARSTAVVQRERTSQLLQV
jgi:hypothetical protein